MILGHCCSGWEDTVSWEQLTPVQHFQKHTIPNSTQLGSFLSPLHCGCRSKDYYPNPPSSDFLPAVFWYHILGSEPRSSNSHSFRGSHKCSVCHPFFCTGTAAFGFRHCECHSSAAHYSEKKHHCHGSSKFCSGSTSLLHVVASQEWCPQHSEMGPSSPSLKFGSKLKFT